jgi:hypothetical protein
VSQVQKSNEKKISLEVESEEKEVFRAIEKSIFYDGLSRQSADVIVSL